MTDPEDHQSSTAYRCCALNAALALKSKLQPGTCVSQATRRSNRAHWHTLLDHARIMVSMRAFSSHCRAGAGIGVVDGSSPGSEVSRCQRLNVVGQRDGTSAAGISGTTFSRIQGRRGATQAAARRVADALRLSAAAS